MKFQLPFCLLGCLLLAGWTAVPVGSGPGPGVGKSDGYPLPRFVSLRTDEVNFRAGPGFQYPVVWVYQRQDLPVEVIGEFDVWRQVLAPDGGTGWVHEATIRAHRSFIVISQQASLRASPDSGAPVLAFLNFGVSGNLLSCAANSDWCKASTGHVSGYLAREDFWGVFPNEAVAGQ
jgi:SH3-like domain-containing protein